MGDRHFSALEARAYFLLLRQKKVAKEKATPGAAPFGFLALLGTPGGCGTRGCAPQTVLAESPRHSCVAQRLPWGPKSVSAPPIAPKKSTSTVNPKNRPKIGNTSASDVFPGPLRGAEQRRGWRIKGEDCLRAQPEFRSAPSDAQHREEVLLGCPRLSRVAQGIPEGDTDPGSPFLCLLSFGEAKESKTPRKGGTPSQFKQQA